MIELPTRDEPVTLIQGDCLDVLRQLPAGSVDAVVTDPPYGIGFKYKSHDDSPEGYGAWLWSVLEECERLCKPGSPVFVWQAMPNVRRFTEWFPRDFRLYAAAKNFVQMRPTTMQYAWDPVVVWWTEGGKQYRAESPKRVTRDFFIADTASVISKPKTIEREHPCPRPLDQVREIVSQWVRPSGLLLDPFGGSGTAAIAAMKEGRRCLLIEKEPAYCEIARRRIAAARAECPLYV